MKPPSPIIVIDTETTGLVAPIIPITLAILPLGGTPESFNVVEDIGDKSGLYMFNPGKAPELGALATHHLLPQDYEDSPPWEGHAAHLPGGVQYLVGHNIDYDWEAIGKPDLKRICTLALARKYWPDIDSHKLSACIYHMYGMKPAARKLLQSAHSALADAYNTTLLFGALVPAIIEASDWVPETVTWGDIWEASEIARVPTIMGFGKNKGVAIADLNSHDPGYIKWMLKQPDVDPYLRIAMEAAPK